MGVSTPARRRPPPWRDVRVHRIVLQVVFLALVAGALIYLYGNLVANMRRQNIRGGIDFLGQSAGFAIAGSEFDSSDTVLAAILVGVGNTLSIAVAGIVLATLVGIVVGVARLSTNWIVRRMAAAYVETFRNVPVLVIIIFLYLGVMIRLPPIDRAVEWGGVLVLSNRGLVIPWFEIVGGVALFLILVAVGLGIAAAVAVWRTRRFDRTGRPHHRVAWAGTTLVVAVVLAFVLSGQPLALSLPERGDLGTTNGFRLTPEYGALLLGLVIYTASHIAEIVRGSILAVPKGQSEAANALALSGFQRMRYVVLPQAFRIMVPPLANQYLNLTKNSSLAVAIAFPDVTRIIGIAISQRAPAPQAIVVLMLIYLCFSLATSLVTNLVNWRLSLRGAR